MALAAVVPGGVFQTPAGQIVNLDLGDPTLFYLNGGPVLAVQPHPGAFTLTTSISSPTIVSGQQMTVDVGHPDGVQLSQAPELTVVAAGGATPLTLSLGDDATLQVLLSSIDPCATGVSFYGTTYTDLWVNSNGDVSFTMGHTTFTATSPTAQWPTPT